MKVQTHERRNTYPAQETFTVRSLLTPEFVSLGCKVERLGSLMLVTRGEGACLLYDSVTTFTSLLASRVLKDKVLARMMLERAGLSIAKGRAYGKGDKERARESLVDIGPAVIKPVDGNQGRGVSVNVTAETFDQAWSAAADSTSNKILVEKYFEGGEEARYLVIGGKCVAVLRRIPPFVHGDGFHTVQQLVDQINAYRETNPSTRGYPIRIDEHRSSIIGGQGLGLDSTPRLGVKVVIDWKANISTGADSEDITAQVHPSMKEVAERATWAVPGADVVGVDILALSHFKEPTEDCYIVIEANTRPGVGDHHYPVFGRPINVGRMIAEHCVRRMGFEIPATISSLPAWTGEKVDYNSSSVSTLPPKIHGRSAGVVGGRSTAISPEVFTIVFAGDTSLGDAYLRKAGAARHLERLETNPIGFFEALWPLICDKSYFIANLETVLAESPRGPLDEIKDHLGWDKPDRTARALKQIGVDAVSLGNNHTMDYGPERLIETMSALSEAGIGVVGAGNNLNGASKELKIASKYGDVYVLAGLEVRPKYKRVYGFYAEEGRPGVNPFVNGEANQIARSISRIRAQDSQAVIIAYPHWGGAANYQWANARMVVDNQSFIAAGADLVLGHGAHMLQQVLAGELGTTAFSLGNFVFNSPGAYKRKKAPPYSLICRLDLKRAESRWAGTLRLYPIVSDNRETRYRPRPVREAEALEVYNLLDQHTEAGFREAFVLERDERGWHLVRTTPLSPRFVTSREG